MTAINLSALPHATIARYRQMANGRPVYVRRRAGYDPALCIVPVAIPVGSRAYGYAERVLFANGWQMVLGNGEPLNGAKP